MIYFRNSPQEKMISKKVQQQKSPRDQRANVKTSAMLKDESLHPQENPPFHARFHGGWRTGVAWSALGAFLVLVINSSIWIWIKSSHLIQEDGTTTLFEGSCGTKRKISWWSHLLINICSTLLLSASNNAMQCLTAPTRADIDRAHKQNVWLDIGVPSLKNLRYIGRTRLTLWIILALSSIPLHLL